MQLEYKKEDQEPSYDNLNPAIEKSKQTPKPYGIRQIIEKPVFKWTAKATVLTTLTIIIVVPTALEVTKQGNKYAYFILITFQQCSNIFTDLCFTQTLSGIYLFSLSK